MCPTTGWHTSPPPSGWFHVPLKRAAPLGSGADANVVSLRDAVSGSFLSERSDGSLTFVDQDTDDGAKWVLRAFEDDVEEFEVPALKRWLPLPARAHARTLVALTERRVTRACLRPAGPPSNHRVSLRSFVASQSPTCSWQSLTVVAGAQVELTHFFLENVSSGRKLAHGEKTVDATDPTQSSFDLVALAVSDTVILLTTPLDSY